MEVEGSIVVSRVQRQHQRRVWANLLTVKRYDQIEIWHPILWSGDYFNNIMWSKQLNDELER